MELVVCRTNMLSTYRKVIGDDGSPGVDGMTVNELKGYLETNWEEIKKKLLESLYYPAAVNQVEIPKRQVGMR